MRLIRVVAYAFVLVFALLSQAQTPALIQDSTLTTSDGGVDVIIVLKTQPQREMLQTSRRNYADALAAAQDGMRKTVSLSSRENAGAVASYEDVLLRVRQDAARAVEAAIAPEQLTAADHIRSVGGTRLRQFSVINAIAAHVPAGAVPEIAADPAVVRVMADERMPALQSSVVTLGAPAFWSAGFMGAGMSVAVLDSGVRADHPAFSSLNVVGKVFLDSAQTMPNFADTLDPSDNDGHGTAVAGVIASRGTPQYLADVGVLRGLGTLYNLKAAAHFNINLPPAGGGIALAQRSDVLAALNYALTQTPVAFFNYSYGSTTTVDDDDFCQQLDQLIDTYDIVFAVAAGNAGPTARTIMSPGIAYNVITVGATDDSNTTLRQDDFLAGFSSRGPTYGFRSKPDVAAPGSRIASTSNTLTNTPFSTYTGTSFASPAIAGAAALLAQATGASSNAVKALLLNSGDGFRWDAGMGWSYANLATAFAERTQVVSDTLTGSAGFKLYSITAHNRSSLVWRRHVNGVTPQFSVLDLALYDPSGAVLAKTSGTVDNVKRVSLVNPGNGVLKVKATSLASGVTSEAFALATSDSDLQAMMGPAFKVVVSNTPIVASQTYTVTATITNSGDITAPAPTATLTAPGAIQGAAAQTIGALAPGTSANLSWKVTATSTPGTTPISVNVQSRVFEETFQATGNTSSNSAAFNALTIIPPDYLLSGPGGSVASGMEVDVPFPANVTAVANQPWLSLAYSGTNNFSSTFSDPNSSGDRILVQAIGTGFTPGVYHGTITVSAVGPPNAYPIAASPQTVDVYYTVSPDGQSPLRATASSLTITAIQGTRSAPQHVDLSYGGLSGREQLTWTTNAGGNLVVSPASGSFDGGFDVSADVTRVGPGHYSTYLYVIVAGTGSINIPVSLTVVPAGTFSVSPTSLVFTRSTLGPPPSPQTVHVVSNALTWTASATHPWVHVTPTSGSDEDMTVSVDPTGLAPGTYNDTVSVLCAGVHLGVDVTLVITDQAAPQAVKNYLPHVVTGNGFATIMTLVNKQDATNNFTINYLDQAGNAAGSKTGLLTPGGTAQVSTGEAARSGPPVTRWATVTSVYPLSVNLFFEYKDPATGAVTNSVGFSDMTPLTDFTIPFSYIAPTGGSIGRTVGLAVANPSLGGTTLTFNLVDATGVVVASVQKTLGGMSQNAFDVATLFPSNVLGATFLGTITVNSSNGQVVAVALVDNFGPFASIPISPFRIR